jgi:hypothetical protein
MNPSKNEIFKRIAEAVEHQPTEEVIPVLITASARALADDAEGDVNLLSTLLLKFCRLVENNAVEMLEENNREAGQATKQ